MVIYLWKKYYLTCSLKAGFNKCKKLILKQVIKFKTFDFFLFKNFTAFVKEIVSCHICVSIFLRVINKQGRLMGENVFFLWKCKKSMYFETIQWAKYFQTIKLSNIIIKKDFNIP